MRVALKRVRPEAVQKNVYTCGDLTLDADKHLVKVGEDGHIIGEIVNISADEKILGDDGMPDASKLQAITFDPVHNSYLVIGGKVGSAFSDGNSLK